MRAVLCERFGPPEQLVLQEVDSPELKEGCVRIKVHAAGVGFPDVLIIQGLYQIKPDLPFSPGSEVAGEIMDAADDVEGFKKGDRVCALTFWGGFAEEAVVDAKYAMAIPDQMKFDIAGGFIMNYGTSYYALKQRGQLQPGETVVVLGAAGGVGLTAVELAKVMGARVIAAASTDEKLQLAKVYGADQYINYSREDLKDRIKHLTGGKGADVLLDPVGGDACEQALHATARDGRVLIVGFASGTVPRIPANLVLLKSCQIVGVGWGGFLVNEREEAMQNNRELFAMFQQGQLIPYVPEIYPLSEAARALTAIMQRKAKGKLVLKC